MIDVSRVAGRICGLGAGLLVACGVAVAQSVIFSTGIPAPIPGGDPAAAVPILLLADVGSPAGPPDGHPDLISADQTPSVIVAFGKGDGTFSYGFSAGIGRIPTALALGDFNGDNAADLVVASGNDVAFLQGNNDGTFKSPVVIAAVGATALAAVDVDNNGHLDLVVVNDSGVTVFLGNGKGGFASGSGTCASGANVGHACSVDTQAVDCPGSTCVSVALSPGGSAIAVADFNGDRNVDLAVTNGNTGTVAVLVGDGIGHFTVSDTLSENSVTKEPVGIAVGDVNGDGHLDIVVVDHGSDDIAVFKGLSGGKFQAPVFFATGPVNSQPDGIALLDVNQDGNLDVAVSNYITSDVSVLLGDGTGSFAAPRAFVSDQEPLALVAGDVNDLHDKIPDLIALNRGIQASDAVVLLGQGDGSFRGVENVIVEDSPNAVLAGDIDNDGQCALIAAHRTGDVLVRRALPAGGFAAPQVLQSHGDAVAVGRGDFNADGWLDIVAVNGSTSDVSVFLGQRNGFSAVRRDYPVGDGASALAVADWNGDGRPDLAVARAPLAAPGVVSILLATPDGRFPTLTSVTVDVNPVALDVGDFNNDGKLDLAVANNVSLNNVHLASAISATATVLTVNDASSLPSSGKIQIDSELIAYTGKSGNQLTGLVRGADGTTAATHSAASVVSAASGLSILFGNGDGTFHAAAHVSVPLQNVTAIAVGDFDNDGNDDIAVAQSPLGGVSILYGSGNGSFSAGFAPLSVGNPSALAVRDLNGDLIPDLLVTDQVANAVLAFVSRGTPRTFQTPVGVTVARMPTSVVAADFDGYGRYDAAAADNFVADVSVLTNISPISAKYPLILRGDGNGDGKVSAADVVAVMRKLGDSTNTRVEQVGRGSYAAKPGADANGDGVVTGQDIFAIAYRLFPRI